MLPVFKNIDVTAINASHKNGILTIDLPKKVEQRDNNVRKIEIQ